MTPTRWEEASVSELVAAYSDAAAEHGTFSEAGDYEHANPCAETIAAVYGELRRRGVAAQEALLPLLSSADLHVRQWAAAHALEFSPQDGERSLMLLAEESGTVGLNATMTLREWREGRLRFP